MHQPRLAVICALTAIMLASVEAQAGADFFTVPVFPVGTAPTSIASGDFNNDGVTDIVTAGANSISVWRQIWMVRSTWSPVSSSSFSRVGRDCRCSAS